MGTLHVDHVESGDFVGPEDFDIEFYEKLKPGDPEWGSKVMCTHHQTYGRDLRDNLRLCVNRDCRSMIDLFTRMIIDASIMPRLPVATNISAFRTEPIHAITPHRILPSKCASSQS